MAIQYNLTPAKLPGISDKYLAKVSITASADLDTIVDQIVQQGSTVTKADIYAVLAETVKVTENLLLHGMRVNLGGLVQLYPTIKGTFSGPLDSFDEGRHSLDVGSTPGFGVRKTIRQKGQVMQKKKPLPEPNIIEVFDFESNEINGTLSINGICSIRGTRLQFDSESADEGLYFIRTSDNTEVGIGNIFRNMPKELIFTVPPSLIAGERYYIEIRSRINGAPDLRYCRFNASFTVS